MELNPDSDLFLRNVFSYDIAACHYNILRTLGVDVSHLDENDKSQRNIQIGMMMRDNPNLVSTLQQTTKSTILEYIARNDLKPSELLINQYDGLITTRPLNVTVNYLPLELRNVFEYFLISSDRKAYLAKQGTEITVKGIPRVYDFPKTIYKRLLELNYINKSSIFRGLDRIKQDVFSDPRVIDFAIPLKDGKYILFLKEVGDVKVNKSLLKMIDIDEVDKPRYFHLYFKSFIESIVYEFA